MDEEGSMFKRLWELTVPFTVHDIKIHGDNLIITSSDGEVGFFTRSGERIHSFDSKLKDPRIHIMGSDTIILCSGNTLASYTFKGEKKWVVTAGKPFNSVKVVPSADTVIAGSDDKYLYIIDSQGNILQKHRSTDPFSCVAIAHRSDLVVSSSDVSLYLLSGSGELKWTYKMRWKINALAMSPTGNLIAAGALTNIYCFDLQQRIKWRNQLDSMPLILRIPENEKYIASALKSGKLLGISTENGSVLWTHNQAGNPITLSMDLSGRYLIYTTGDDSGSKHTILYGGRVLDTLETSGRGVSDISPDGSYIALSLDCDIVLIENLHIYRSRIASYMKLMDTIEDSSIDASDEKINLEEARIEMESGNYERGSMLFKEAERHLNEKLETFCSSKLPEMEKRFQDLRGVLASTDGDRVARMEKLLSLTRKRLESGSHTTAIKVLSRAAELLKEMEDRAEKVRAKTVQEQYSGDLASIKMKVNNLRNMGLDTSDMEAEINNIEALISMGKSQDAGEMLSTLVDRVDGMLSEIRRSEAEKKLSRMETYISTGKEKGFETFDMEGLLQHARDALDSGDYDTIGELLKEVERIYNKREKLNSPEMQDAKTKIQEVEALIDDLEDNGVMVDRMRDDLSEAESILAADPERASTLIDRLYSEARRLSDIQASLKENIKRIEEAAASLPENMKMSILSRLEEAQFSIAAGDVKRAFSITETLLKKLENVSDESEEMKCPSCGGELREGVRFCPRCGVALSTTEPVGDTCPSCGAAVMDEDRFCATCGRRLRQ